MASIKDDGAIDELMTALQEGSRGRPSPEKIQKSINPDTGRFPEGEFAEYLTRMLMNDDAEYGEEGMGLSDDSRNLGPGNLQMDETNLLRSMSKAKPMSEKNPTQAPTFNTKKYNSYSGAKARNDLRHSQGIEGKLAELRKDPVRLKEFITKMANFSRGGDTSGFDGKDLVAMFGLTKKSANDHSGSIKEALGDDNSAESVMDKILSYTDEAPKKRATKKKSTRKVLR